MFKVEKAFIIGLTIFITITTLIPIYQLTTTTNYSVIGSIITNISFATIIFLIIIITIINALEKIIDKIDLIQAKILKYNQKTNIQNKQLKEQEQTIENQVDIKQ